MAREALGPTVGAPDAVSDIPRVVDGPNGGSLDTGIKPHSRGIPSVVSSSEVASAKYFSGSNPREQRAARDASMAAQTANAPADRQLVFERGQSNVSGPERSGGCLREADPNEIVKVGFWGWLNNYRTDVTYGELKGIKGSFPRKPQKP